MNFNAYKDIKRSVKWRAHFSVGRRWTEGKNEDILVDVLRSGKSVFSLFYVCLFNKLFSLHVFFVDTEDCTEKAKYRFVRSERYFVYNTLSTLR